MNVWTFTGRLGADAELRTLQSGDKLLSLRVANDVGYGDRRTTQWVDCVIWGKRGESIAAYLTRGKQVVISGEVSLKTFQKRDGSEGTHLSVRVAEIDFFGGGGDRPQSSGGSSGSRDSGAGSGASGRKAAPPPHDDLDDEIPF